MNDRSVFFSSHGFSAILLPQDPITVGPMGVMAEENTVMSDAPGHNKPPRTGGFLGSLKDALAAASRDDTARAPGPLKGAANAPAPASPTAISAVDAALTPSPMPAVGAESPPAAEPATKALSAAQAAREARGTTHPLDNQAVFQQDNHMEFDAPRTTRLVRPGATKPRDPAPAAVSIAELDDTPARTQLVRGRQPLKRGQFHQDPVVGWLVIVGGPGLGAYRPVFEGNNTIGRSSTSRVPLDFGDETISSEEQAYIRYDSNDRGFLFVPNLAKTNVVSINNKRPSAAVELVAMDVITMGRTQLVFMPFCGSEFDWSEITETKD
jgi:FHA domain